MSWFKFRWALENVVHVLNLQPRTFYKKECALDTHKYAIIRLRRRRRRRAGVAEYVSRYRSGRRGPPRERRLPTERASASDRPTHTYHQRARPGNQEICGRATDRSALTLGRLRQAYTWLCLLCVLEAQPTRHAHASRAERLQRAAPIGWKPTKQVNNE